MIAPNGNFERSLHQAVKVLRSSANLLLARTVWLSKPPEPLSPLR